MSLRRTHYELAFETHLDRRGTPYVAVEDVHHFVRGRTGIKTFDYIVYPASGPACLVDVKGRKSISPAGGGEVRRKNWVTRDDVTGLLSWQDVFGEGYAAVFVFAYWLAGERQQAGSPEEEQGGYSLRFAGRRYSFWLVMVEEYAKHQTQLSKSWGTVHMPREVFRAISKPLESTWPASPC
ncbi:MAG: HYExAFE family protein [Planctomycetota bacterium]